MSTSRQHYGEADFESDDGSLKFHYKENADGTITVTGATDTSYNGDWKQTEQGPSAIEMDGKWWTKI